MSRAVKKKPAAPTREPHPPGTLMVQVPPCSCCKNQQRFYRVLVDNGGEWIGVDVEGIAWPIKAKDLIPVSIDDFEL